MYISGGQNLENDENTGFSRPMIRKARVKALFNSYEVTQCVYMVEFLNQKYVGLWRKPNDILNNNNNKYIIIIIIII